MWVIGALIASAGLAVYVEFGTGLPRSGGELTYLNYLFKRPRYLAVVMYAAYAATMPWPAGNSTVFGQCASASTFASPRAPLMADAAPRHYPRGWQGSHTVEPARNRRCLRHLLPDPPRLLPQVGPAPAERARRLQAWGPAAHRILRLRRARGPRPAPRRRAAAQLPERVRGHVEQRERVCHRALQRHLVLHRLLKR
jgi:hypothetical protein